MNYLYLRKIGKVLILLTASFFVYGCQSDGSNAVLSTSKSQLEIRSIQTRYFESSNKTQMLRSILATLQDLGFVINKADAELGTCSATKFGNQDFSDYELRMTVSVRSRGKKKMLVRANATKGEVLIEDPKAYQDFFSALGKAIFLTANKID
jgi:hypothetical protein